MAKTAIRVNTTVKFDETVEKDILRLIQECSEQRRLNRLLEAALRVCLSTKEGRKQLENGLGGFPVDSERETLLEQLREDSQARRDEIMDLAADVAIWEQKVEQTLDNLTKELTKLYVYADSANLLELKVRAPLVHTEALLVSELAKKIQKDIWDKAGRPTMFGHTNGQDNGKKELSELAHEVMVYLSEHYAGNLMELRSLFAQETTEQQKQTQVDMTGALSQMMEQFMRMMNSVPQAQAAQGQMQTAQLSSSAQPTANTGSPAMGSVSVSAEGTEPDMDAVLEMFGSTFDD